MAGRDLALSSELEDFDALLLQDDDPFPVSQDYPNNALVSIYQNLASLDPEISSGFPLIQFEPRGGDTAYPWYYKSVNRDTAHKTLHQKPVGTYMVRPSSRANCHALSFVHKNKDIIHQVIHAHHTGYSREENPTKQQLYPTLAQLIDACAFLSVPLCSNELTGEEVLESLKQSGLALVTQISQLLEDDDERLNTLHWELKQKKDVNGRVISRKTIVRYCRVEYVAPDFLPFQGIVAKTIFEALEENTVLKELTIHGDPDLNCCLMDDDILILAKSLIQNKALESINLENNQISDKGAFYLAKGLLRNKNVRNVNLKNNFIHTRGLRACAQLLQANHQMDKFLVASQFLYKAMRGKSLHNDSYCTFLSHLIETSLIRKTELAGAQMQFLCRAEVSHRLADKALGHFLFYLDHHVTNSIILACVVPVGKQENCVIHLPIFRTPFGYATNLRTYEPPSLLEHCLWSISSIPGINDSNNTCSSSSNSTVNKKEPQFGTIQEKLAKTLTLPGVKKKWEKTLTLQVLWGITHIPPTRPDLSEVYPALKDILSNLQTAVAQSIFIGPINKKK